MSYIRLIYSIKLRENKGAKCRCIVSNKKRCCSALERIFMLLQGYLPEMKKYTYSAVIFALFCLFSSGCATRGALPLEGPSVGFPISHFVQPGETLWSLSKEYGVTLEELMFMNGIADASQLQSGQRLWIPSKGAGQIRRTQIPEPKHKWTHIVIHHSATRDGNADIFDRDHRQRGFWNGLGYHFVICNGTSGTRDGQIQVGDRWVKQILGAHCNVGNMNEVGIGICLVGDFENGQRVTAKQFDSLIRLVRSLQKAYEIPERNVLRHLDVKTTTECPGRNFPWREFKGSILSSGGFLFAERRASVKDNSLTI